MSDLYIKELLRVAVAQICQTIGYNATQTASLELLQDILDKFLKEFTRDLRRQVEHYNRTEANLNDVALTLSSINVNLNELTDYINNVEPVPFVIEMPKFPRRKDSYLNFLKPGSKEVLTRPVHVHDHLPPMLPPDIREPPDNNILNDVDNGVPGLDVKPSPDKLHGTEIGNANNATTALGETNSTDATGKPQVGVSLDKNTLQSLFKSTIHLEDGERSINNTREISSVVMTTGGYISPAIEGKMPEAIIPDIINELFGLDAPPPPPPPPPPAPPAPLSNSKPASRTILPGSSNKENTAEVSTDASKDTITNCGSGGGVGDNKKSANNKSLDFTSLRKSEKQSEYMPENFPNKTDKISSHLSNTSNECLAITTPSQLGNKKSLFMAHTGGVHSSAQASFANMLLKKAKKQKPPPNLHGQLLADKQPFSEKLTGKSDAGEKAQRKYVKMLQKMVKQGKIPAEFLQTLLGPDKKLKNAINPAIVASMPHGPEKMQLEKLLRKQTKQREKFLKHQKILMDAQKPGKKSGLANMATIFPPQVPNRNEIMTPVSKQELFKDNVLSGEREEKLGAPTTSPIKANIATANSIISANNLLNDASNNRVGVQQQNESLSALDVVTTGGGDLKDPKTGMEIKLSNEPDRSKLNIFKKISKQKANKAVSPTPGRIPSLNDTSPVINLPSGTTITPAPGPSGLLAQTSLSSVAQQNLPRSMFPNDLSAKATGVSNNIALEEMNKQVLPMGSTLNQPNQDLSMLKRVFGEKAAENVDMANKPKKRGRKPGSKNSPKLPGVLSNAMLKKNKKLKMDTGLFPPPYNAVGAPLLNPLNPNNPFDTGAAANMFPMFSLNEKQLQQQIMAMAATKEKKERKKNKLLKNLPINLLHNNAALSSLQVGSVGVTSIPTSEEVQSINKKLMRMDTILKPAPAPTNNAEFNNDSSIASSGQKPLTVLPGPTSATFPVSPNLKSPGNTKRLPTASDLSALPPSLQSPFMLSPRPGFPNLPGNMLNMLPFPFPPRPGLIPTHGLFPTPGLTAFPNSNKTSAAANLLLTGVFPFPNLKHAAVDNQAKQETENLGGDHKKADANLPNNERNYCNVAPLVPEFLKLTTPDSLNTKVFEDQQQQQQQQHQQQPNENASPKNPKSRQSHTTIATVSQDNLLTKNMADTHPLHDSVGNVGNKYLPSTPSGLSLNSFEQLMKKNENPVELLPLPKGAVSKHSSSAAMDQTQNPIKSNLLGMDFSMHKKVIGLNKPPPITLNADEPIEVSDDSDETSQVSKTISSKTLTASNLNATQPAFNADDMFASSAVSSLAGGVGSKLPPLDTELSSKELKKLKKQVKKASALANTNSTLINPEKAEPGAGVGKLAGGADLIPLHSTGLAYSSKNIPFNSLTGNANPTFGSHNKDLLPSSSSATSTSVFDNVTITPALTQTGMVAGGGGSMLDLQKKRKEHKKMKKLKELKEGKVKKKKDKKDKAKSKEKAEKYLLAHQQLQQHQQQLPSSVKDFKEMGEVATAGEKVKDKDLLKKLKKEKKKEKQRLPVVESGTTVPPACTFISGAKEAVSANPSSLETGEGKKSKTSNISTSKVNEQESMGNTAGLSCTVIPKLTLKLGSNPSPTPTEAETNSLQKFANVSAGNSNSPLRREMREPSPELARISPLVTRPPKQKLNTSGELSSSGCAAAGNMPGANTNTLDTSFGDTSKSSTTANVGLLVPPPSPWLSGGTISASSVLLPHQLLQTSKSNELTSQSTSVGHSSDTSNRHSSSSDRQSPLTLITETSRPSSYIDAEGNRVWICPACGKVDDGSPMIGCDGCDAWYHWVCVGIVVAPKDNEDWFCRVCITRSKKGIHGSDKKRKRTKKK
uniref:PHD-type domain-containing protein n=1 Tax=Glossina morsitans morsitans TaxID=37546 RepID=A0A1B0G831_GLOMM